MSFLIRLSTAKRPAVIALLAMLLLFIAPEISQTLQYSDNHTPVAGQTMAGMPAMSATMPDMPATEHRMTTTLPSNPPSSSDDNMPGMAGIACGYCIMLLHMPLLQALIFSLCGLCLIRRFLPQIRRRFILPLSRFSGDVQPRAPPAGNSLLSF